MCCYDGVVIRAMQFSFLYIFHLFFHIFYLLYSHTISSPRNHVLPGNDVVCIYAQLHTRSIRKNHSNGLLNRNPELPTLPIRRRRVIPDQVRRDTHGHIRQQCLDCLKGRVCHGLGPPKQVS